MLCGCALRYECLEESAVSDFMVEDLGLLVKIGNSGNFDRTCPPFLPDFIGSVSHSPYKKDQSTLAGFSEHWQHIPYPHGTIIQNHDDGDRTTIKAFILSANICCHCSFLLFL